MDYLLLLLVLNFPELTAQCLIWKIFCLLRTLERCQGLNFSVPDATYTCKYCIYVLWCEPLLVWMTKRSMCYSAVYWLALVGLQKVVRTLCLGGALSFGWICIMFPSHNVHGLTQTKVSDTTEEWHQGQRIFDPKIYWYQGDKFLAAHIGQGAQGGLSVTLPSFSKEYTCLWWGFPGWKVRVSNNSEASCARQNSGWQIQGERLSYGVIGLHVSGSKRNCMPLPNSSWVTCTWFHVVKSLAWWNVH